MEHLTELLQTNLKTASIAQQEHENPFLSISDSFLAKDAFCVSV